MPVNKQKKFANVDVTASKSFDTYMHDIGEIPSYQLKQAFQCGLPGVWLYMKSIGQEEAYFSMLRQAKERSILFKDLYYLLMLTNSNNDFFPKVPKDMLKIAIPKEYLEAQPGVGKPEFQMGYKFTRDQMKETLQKVCQPDKMVRIGNKYTSIGIMFTNNKYYVYHADNTEALEYSSLDKCIDVVWRLMKAGS